MIKDLLLGIGLVAVLEGLVLALAPLRFEDILDTLRRMSVDQRRMLGLGMMAIGVVLVWLVR